MGYSPRLNKKEKIIWEAELITLFFLTTNTIKGLKFLPPCIPLHDSENKLALPFVVFGWCFAKKEKEKKEEEKRKICRYAKYLHCGKGFIKLQMKKTVALCPLESSTGLYQGFLSRSDCSTASIVGMMRPEEA